MALRAQKATGNKDITVLADRGYFNGDQVLACENTGVLPCVPKTLTSSSAKRGLFTRQDFVYDAEKDHYTCPAGQHLTRGRVRSDRRQDVDNYRHLTACFTCPLKPRCTPDKLKRVKRWEHEDVLDAMQARLDRMPDAMLVRRQTVEHPYGTIKVLDGLDPLLDPHLEAGQHRNEPPRPGLQHQAGDRDHWCRTAAAGDPGLSAWISSQTLPQPDCGVSPPSSANPFFHGLGGKAASRRPA